MKLNFPEYEFKIEKDHQSRLRIFDSIRRKWIVLTPEEWVRQHVIAFLIHSKRYPGSLIAVEREISFNNLRKRFDILVFSNSGQPYMLIECKAPEVKLSSETLFQICTYNTNFNVPFLFVTNGIDHALFRLNSEEGYKPESDFPVL